MKHNRVGTVMTTEVVRAAYGTPFKEVARLLTDLMVRQAETPALYGPL